MPSAQIGLWNNQYCIFWKIGSQFYFQQHALNISAFQTQELLDEVDVEMKQEDLCLAPPSVSDGQEDQRPCQVEFRT